MEQKFCVHCMSEMSGDVCSVCARSDHEYEAAPHRLQPGTILNGRYIIGKALGEGGFGITYIGRDLNLDLRVAVKEYYPFGMVNRGGGSMEVLAGMGEAEHFFEKGKRSFLGEARTLAKFSAEPSIVSVRDFFPANNTAYIVMEYLEGTDLRDHLAHSGAMTFEQSVSMLAPVMSALSKIHAQGLIHRDISPANIMILKNGAIKLLDFGATREVSEADEKSLSVLLKPGFAPEEQYRTKGHQGPWTDVYALSATIYKMVTGKTPIDAMNRLFCDELKSIPGLTSAQEAAILKGMAIQQDDRYQTVDELYAACRAACESERKAQPDEKTPQPPKVRESAKDKPKKKAEPKPVKTEKERSEETAKSGKKPRLFGLIACVLFSLFSMMFIPNTVSLIATEEVSLYSIFIAVFSLAAAILTGLTYFPRVDHQEKKPNKFCFFASIITALIPLYFALNTYLLFSDPLRDEGSGEFGFALTLCTCAIPVFFGFFYYPRLERKQRVRFAKIYGGIAAGLLALCFCAILFKGFNELTIGDSNIKRSEDSISFNLDIITDQDMEKLAELKNLKQLSFYSCFLDDDDMTRLGELTQLKSLVLTGNTDITNVAALNNLTQLTYLSLNSTKVTDISCLDQLVNLETLDISGTKIKDFSFLSKFTKLETLKIDAMMELDFATISFPESLKNLYCNANGIDSIDFIHSATSLTQLYAAGNLISDLTPLTERSLYALDLSANRVSDITPLNLQSISKLDLSTNQITDISHLEGCLISDLDLSYNQITDISPLFNNHKLAQLNLCGNQIVDISPLRECFRIWNLDISYNQISDISVLEWIDDLKFFAARGNRIADISALASCQTLISNGNTLDLRDNEIIDISALAGYVNTRHIYLSGNKISDITPLASCSALQMIKLNNNNVSDISPLTSLPKLRFVEVAGNPVRDAAGLSFDSIGEGLLEGGSLDISYHEDIDFERLAQIKNLNVVIYDATEREKDALRDLGYWAFASSDTLDPIDKNPDLAEEETEENNG